MNHKKWREKFGHKDSRRFLKKHEPYYSAELRQGCMPPVWRWIRVARDIMRAYPGRKQWYELMMGNPSMRAWSAERVALTILCRDAQIQMDAVEAAIREQQEERNGALRVELARLVYWEGTPFERARQALGLDRERADRMDYYFLRSVAWHAGYHYNHVGKNRFGNTRKSNKMNR